MTGLLFFDTNVLVYGIDPTDPAKRRRAADLVRRAILRGAFIVSPQILNECYRVLTDKRRLLSRDVARTYVGEFMPFCLAPLDATTTQRAFVVQDRLGTSWWDSLVVASALQAGAEAMVSEDLAFPSAFADLRFVDPFATPSDPILS
jgi:predicted nucleic acid-binding protein